MGEMLNKIRYTDTPDIFRSIEICIKGECPYTFEDSQHRATSHSILYPGVFDESTGEIIELIFDGQTLGQIRAWHYASSWSHNNRSAKA
jgi:hypothetical protein